jgi:hypothetical protein
MKIDQVLKQSRVFFFFFDIGGFKTTPLLGKEEREIWSSKMNPGGNGMAYR